MDLSGLTAVTTAAEMQTWLSANCLSPISPVMTGTDFGIMMRKIIDVAVDADTTITAGNGITLLGSFLELGGTLQNGVTIDPAASYFAVANSKAALYVNAQNPGINLT